MFRIDTLRVWFALRLQGSLRASPTMSLSLVMCLGACATPPQPSLDVFSSLQRQAAEREALSAGGRKAPPPAQRRNNTEVIIVPSGPLATNTAVQPKGGVFRPPATPPFGITSPETGTSSADLWFRLRRGFSMPDLNSVLVQTHEQWYAARPEHVQRTSERASRYLFHIVEEVQRRNMPAELALLPFVESAFNPQAVSPANASGIWQFMPATAQSFDLRRNMFRDDRRDVLASTRAALDYLGKLHSMFGHWHLALAAYNWGEGNVQKALDRNRSVGLPTDYQSLQLPQETRHYVPKLLAVRNIIARPDSFGLRLPALDNQPYFWKVPIDRDIDLALAVELSGIEREEFAQLNPQINKPIILAAGTRQLLLPYDNARRFETNLKAHAGPLATWTTWSVPHKMRLSDVARQVGCSETLLREVNSIPRSMLVNGGSTLLVPRSRQSQEDVSTHLADNAVMSLTPEPRSVD